MKLTHILVGSLASVAYAHGEHSVPKMVGGRQLLSEMRVRNSAGRLASTSTAAESRILQRQTADGRCGQNRGNCPTSQCCSAEGYCGTGTEYCAAPDCQYQYGPACDANKKPAGTSTANVARPQLGLAEYGGTGIYNCVQPGQIALTYDDGPYIYTSTLLDKLAAYNAKATFFITGNNLGKGAIDSTAQWSNLIKRMAAEGHQIASHTWSHQDLSTLDATTFQNQMVYNEMAFNNILGYFPTYMRPPYSSCDTTCAARLKTLGYHITYFDVDTEGYLHTLPTQIQTSKDIWTNTLRTANPSSAKFLEIEHDIHDQVVNNLTDFMLSTMYSKGFKSVTVGDCLNDPQANWYRAGSGVLPSSASTSSVPTSTTSTTAGPSSTLPVQAISVDGSCSTTITCLGSEFGNCCSQYGWCGSTTDYCDAGCNPASGTCNGIVLPDPLSSSTSTQSPTTQSPIASSSSTTTRLSTTTTSTSLSTTTTTTTRTTTTTSRTTTTTTTTRPTPTPPPPPPPPVVKVSTDGSCGGRNGYTCTGSRYGRCCSSSGRCGSAGFLFIQPYCGAGCQPAYGSCN